jgi:hypothetical protein
MRLALVHGINNENLSAKEIEEQWMSVLRSAWRRAGLVEPSELTVETAFYGDKLAQLAEETIGAVSAGLDQVVASLPAALMQEYASGIGVSDSDVEAALIASGVDANAVPAGVPHERWVIALACAIERLSPFQGRYLVRCFLRQAGVYLERRGVQSIVKNLVRSQILKGSPTVVLAHSLGTVVSYELLTEAPTGEVPLFCTFGSPLGVHIVSNYVGTRSSFPRPPIARWINALDHQDFVTLGRHLAPAVMGFEGIENLTVHNLGDDKHDASMYLANKELAQEIHHALTKS